MILLCVCLCVSVCVSIYLCICVCVNVHVHAGACIMCVVKCMYDYMHARKALTHYTVRCLISH